MSVFQVHPVDHQGMQGNLWLNSVFFYNILRPDTLPPDKTKVWKY